MVLGVGSALSEVLLATLLDLTIEPVAVHVVLSWEWLAPGPVNYYEVPLANFIAWFACSGVRVNSSGGMLYEAADSR